MKEKLQSIYNALNTIQVSGKQNCAIVAGVMNVIEELFVEEIAGKGAVRATLKKYL